MRTLIITIRVDHGYMRFRLFFSPKQIALSFARLMIAPGESRGQRDREQHCSLLASPTCGAADGFAMLGAGVHFSAADGAFAANVVDAFVGSKAAEIEKNMKDGTTS